MASRLDGLIREHAERLDRLAGPIDLTDVTSAPRHGDTTVELVDVEPSWTQPEGRHRRSMSVVAAAAVAVVVGSLVIATRTDDPTGQVSADQPTPPLHRTPPSHLAGRTESSKDQMEGVRV